MVKNIKKRKGFLYCILLCTVIVVGIPQIAKAAGEIAINETNFPDDIFRDYVSSQFDKDNNKLLSEEEIANVTQIDVQGKEIYNLKGVEYFTTLTDLDCSSNWMSELDVSKNTVLKNLSCYANELTNLDVSMNVVLKNLSCYDNELTKLDVSKNTALITLNCGFNRQMTELDISKNTALTDLHCCSNNLSKLDISKSIALTGLNCGFNCLSELDVSKNINLTHLTCDNNSLTDLDLSKNMALLYLSCSSNCLISLDLSKNTALTYLYCPSYYLAEVRLHSQTYNILPLYKDELNYGSTINISDLQNAIIIDDEIKVMDITKPATYKVNGKDFTIIYADTLATPLPIPSITPAPSAMPSALPSSSPVAPSGAHIFSDYNYNNPVTSQEAVIYGNGGTKTIDGKKVNSKVFTAYTDILASYKYTLNNKGIVKTSVGKVIVGITKSAVKPEVNNKNKITDTSASKIARAKIKNGQITVTAVGKEGGLVYLWVIDTGSKGVSACCPVNVKLAPVKLEVQDKPGNKLAKNTKLGNGKTLAVCVTGYAGTTKTDDGTYTATVDSKYQGYVTVTPVSGSTNQFVIKATGLKNNKDTKAAVTFQCVQNGRKINLPLVITQ
ncbi:MAG: hypothetical protein HFH68_10845 [Lachnospiraceae bacterium]|nr:hypothetical protein [Lachnospiraceae bacterium]